MQTSHEDAQVYLASLSPRRAELLDQLQIKYQVLTLDVDETFLENETPSECVLRLATAKADAGLKLALSKKWSNRPIIAADTIVVVDDDLLGKPRDRADAVRMLKNLSGRTHKVVTGVSIRFGGVTETCVSESQVIFKSLSESEIERYWQSGEPRDKAGAYAIQGIGACFVRQLEGSYSGVMGLPLHETSELLAKLGLPVI